MPVARPATTFTQIPCFSQLRFTGCNESSSLVFPTNRSPVPSPWPTDNAVTMGCAVYLSLSRIGSGPPGLPVRAAMPMPKTSSRATAAGISLRGLYSLRAASAFRIFRSTFRVFASVHSVFRTRSSRVFFISIFFIEIPSLQIRLQDCLGLADTRIQRIDVRTQSHRRFLQ